MIKKKFSAIKKILDKHAIDFDFPKTAANFWISWCLLWIIQWNNLSTETRQLMPICSSLNNATYYKTMVKKRNVSFITGLFL